MRFPTMEREWIGKLVKFTECDSDQVNYAGDSDPREYLVLNNTYVVKKAVVLDWSTTLELEGFPDKNFNSVCFEDI